MYPEVSLTELCIFPLKSLGERGQFQILLLHALHLPGFFLEQLLILVVFKVYLLLEQTEIPDDALHLDDLVFECLKDLLAVLNLRDVLHLGVVGLLVSHIQVVEVNLQLCHDFMCALRVHLELLPGFHHIREQLLVRRGKSGDLCLKLSAFLLVLLGISLVGIVLDLVLLVLVLGFLELALHALKFLVQLVELLLEGFWGGPTRIDLRSVQGFLHLFHGGREDLEFADDDSLVELHANLSFDARDLVQIQRSQASLRLLYQLYG